MRRGEGHAHEDAARDQPRQHRTRKGPVAPAIDGHEIGGRGQRVQPVVARNGSNRLARLGDPRDRGLQVPLIGQSRQRRRLRHAAHAEMVADLVEGIREIGMRQPIAHAQPGQPVRLGEGAQPDNARMVHIKRQDGTAGRGIGIGLVECQHRPLGQRIDHRLHGRRLMPASHRVVGIGEIDQFCINRPRLGQKRVWIFMVARIGHLVQHAAKTRHMVVEGGIGPVRGHDRIAGADEQPHEIAQQPVDPLAHHDIGAGHPVMRSDRFAQIVKLGVAIHPRLTGGLFHRRNRARAGAKDAFIGPDPRHEGGTARAFLRLGPDKGDRCGQGFDKGGIARRFHIRSESRKADALQGPTKGSETDALPKRAGIGSKT